jgi:hypothetical protein
MDTDATLAGRTENRISEPELTREEQNAEHADTGRTALIAVFADRWPNKPKTAQELFEDDIIDLLTCLLHAAHAAEGNAVQAAAKAIAYFQREIGVDDLALGALDNNERAERRLVTAEVAAAVYRGTAFDQVASEELLGDAIADWLHLATRDQGDPAEILERARYTFEHDGDEDEREASDE